jgi:hypothetical protein
MYKEESEINMQEILIENIKKVKVLDDNQVEVVTFY